MTARSSSMGMFQTSGFVCITPTICGRGANASVSDAGFVDGWISDVTHPESLDVGPYDHLVSMFVASDRYRTELVGFFDTAFGLDPTIMRPG